MSAETDQKDAEIRKLAHEACTLKSEMARDSMMIAGSPIHLAKNPFAVHAIREMIEAGRAEIAVGR